MEKFNKITLDNGLRIITVPKPDSLATTILVLVEAGSKYETKEINGISHFLEHMCFKGTKKRPKGIDIFSELDGIGAISNAFTSLEYTGYYAKARPEHFDKILDVVSDVYLNPILESTEINKEKGTIIEEINFIEDTPIRKVWDYFLELLYGDQPAGWDIVGRKEAIKKLNRDDFVRYRNEHYLAKSSLVVLAGKFNENEAIRKIEQAFSGIKSDIKKPKIKTIEQQQKPEILLRYKETDQTHLVLGVRAFDIFDKRRYILEVLSDILGGGASSRLFQKIREEMSAAYYVYADTDLYTDHGYLAVPVGIDNKRVEEILQAILEEFKKLAQEPVEKNELQRAKDHLTGTMLLGLETSDALASFYGGQEIITRQLLTPQGLVKKYQAVKAEEILGVANYIFQNDKLNLALIGPFKDKEKFEKILTL